MLKVFFLFVLSDVPYILVYMLARNLLLNFAATTRFKEFLIVQAFRDVYLRCVMVAGIVSFSDNG